MKNFRGILCMILMFLGIITGIACSLIMVVNQIRNPDMTRMRLLIEYWDTALIGIGGLVIGFIGGILLAKD